MASAGERWPAARARSTRPRSGWPRTGRVKSQCSCPAWGEYGPHCKHVVALAYADRAETLGPAPASEPARPADIVPLPALAKLESWLGLSAAGEPSFVYRLAPAHPRAAGRSWLFDVRRRDAKDGGPISVKRFLSGGTRLSPADERIFGELARHESRFDGKFVLSDDDIADLLGAAPDAAGGVPRHRAPVLARARPTRKSTSRRPRPARGPRSSSSSRTAAAPPSRPRCSWWAGGARCSSRGRPPTRSSRTCRRACGGRGCASRACPSPRRRWSGRCRSSPRTCRASTCGSGPTGSTWWRTASPCSSSPSRGRRRRRGCSSGPATARPPCRSRPPPFTSATPPRRGATAARCTGARRLPSAPPRRC